eukprot:m.12102 g.12102  ORF g.12102 m.12102 type:complete len:91 (-) comp3954_c0_seq1:263-535(-)
MSLFIYLFSFVYNFRAVAFAQHTMESIDGRCTAEKKEYEKCFNAWYVGEFLKGGGRKNDPCTELFEKYNKCLKKALLDLGIDVSEGDEDE